MTTHIIAPLFLMALLASGNAIAVGIATFWLVTGLAFVLLSDSRGAFADTIFVLSWPACALLDWLSR